jgi:hypothetical protein
MKIKKQFILIDNFIFLFFALLICNFSYAQLKAKITASKTQINEFCGTTNVKIVFGCQNELYFVDFSDSFPQFQKINNTVSAFFPVISSDGKWITYQTGVNVEGPSSGQAKGTIWLRRLVADATPIKIADTAYVPRFVQNTSADTLEIIYSTSVTCPQSLCYLDGKTLKKKIINGIPQSSETITENGSYYGGISWDNRYLCTAWPGGPNAFMLDLQNGNGNPVPVHNIRVKKQGTDIDTFITIGGCNPSRSASRIFTNTMLYFDFSSSAITLAKCYHPLLGKWKEHQLLFISRYDGEDLKVFNTPSDKILVPISSAEGKGEAVGKEWNNPEWSNHPYFAVASLLIDRLFFVSNTWEHTLNNEAIYIVNLKDSIYLKIIESTDTSYSSNITFTNPFIWIEIPSDFKEDSTWLKQTIWERSAGVIKPFKETLHSVINKIPDDAKVYIYSLSGKKMICNIDFIQLNKYEHKLKSGIYFIEIKDKFGSKFFCKVIKIK